jgi:hypothetical protein
LYGPTLVTFLLAELIGRTLVDKIGVKPHLVLVERADLLELRRHISLPVACLVEGEETERPSVRLGRQSVVWHIDFSEDKAGISRGASTITSDADLSEPFQRVRDALNEALGSACMNAAPQPNREAA